MVLAGIVDEFTSSFGELFGGIMGFLPNLLGAILIFVIGRIIAKMIFRLVATVLRKANVDRLVDRSGLGGPLERAGFPDAGVFLAKILYWLIMVVIIGLAVDVLGIEALQDLIDQLAAWLPKLFVAILILFVTGAAANFVKDLVSGMTATQSWGNLASNAAAAGIWFIGGMMALDQAQIGGDIVNTLFTAVMSALTLILVIKYGVGGIWAARDRFWPSVYDRVGGVTKDTSV